MWLVIRLTESSGLAMATTLLPELLVLLASSLLLIFSLAGFFVFHMVFRKAAWVAVERSQEARKRRIVSTNEVRSQPSIRAEKPVGRRIVEFGGGAPASTSPQWTAVVKQNSFARHV